MAKTNKLSVKRIKDLLSHYNEWLSGEDDIMLDTIYALEELLCYRQADNKKRDKKLLEKRTRGGDQ